MYSKTLISILFFMYESNADAHTYRHKAPNNHDDCVADGDSDALTLAHRNATAHAVANNDAQPH